ncbi:endonuclease/exonuclease/phosphatase family protein [Kribbella sp. CA-293567]|nr:endonuclease/exonuclease/phosphatase family protein [Kribbella sp. CA-293567]WBQ08604.1 endonuclease/exonuclease/phosphatase family protein [Kribbella sp. CA-293567]
MPLRRSRLRARYAAIAAAFETSSVQVVNFQEVLTYYHFRLLAQGLPTFRGVYRPSAAGPAGGVVTFSRLPVESVRYQRSPAPRSTELSLRWRGFLKGALVSRIDGMCFVNVHLLANTDGSWSAENRFHPIHRAQLASFARLLGEVASPCVVTGDFNIPRHKSLVQEFLATTGLADAFDGQCPPTFQAAYLSVGMRSQCIDFALLSGVKATDTELLFPNEKPGLGYVSDHLGLRARLVKSLPDS